MLLGILEAPEGITVTILWPSIMVSSLSNDIVLSRC